MNRRNVLMGLGALGGLAAVKSAPLVHASAQNESLSSTQVLQSLRLTGEREEKFLHQLGRKPSAVQPWPTSAIRRDRQAVEAEVVMKRDRQGKTIASGLRFLCDARKMNCFTVQGRPLMVKRFCFSAVEIAWRPGDGFPVYEAYCPRYEYVSGACYQAKVHQIVPLLVDVGNFAGCQSADVCESPQRGQMAFDVNHTDYQSNDGSYTIQLWSWS
ncbi:Hypothetical protein PBC10988_34160 [Planctomycetales bacterium 10988]|nr:Hypothetical protein PBC10988_34160 [Planctomycetales bacterium 10988]